MPGGPEPGGIEAGRKLQAHERVANPRVDAQILPHYVGDARQPGTATAEDHLVQRGFAGGRKENLQSHL